MVVVVDINIIQRFVLIGGTLPSAVHLALP